MFSAKDNSFYFPYVPQIKGHFIISYIKTMEKMQKSGKRTKCVKYDNIWENVTDAKASMHKWNNTLCYMISAMNLAGGQP